MAGNFSDLTHPKILERDSFLSALEKARQGRVVVFTNGCFDLLHPGHVDYLARARALGDLLVVGVNDDASVRRLDKGRGRPFNTLARRMFVLAHLASVDFVTPFGEDTPLELISACLPEVLVKGGDWPVEKIVGRDVVEARQGKVLSLPLLEGYSTTAIIEKIRTET